MSLVSIVTPFFNRSSLVIDFLESVLNQSYKNWECILVDDGSDEFELNTMREFIEKDERFVLLSRPYSILKGANACRNIGLKHSKGEFIIFFDSDDLMARTCLENRVNTFNNNIEFDFLVFSMGHFVDKLNCYIDDYRKCYNANNAETIEEFFFSGKLPWQGSRPIFKSKFIKNKIWFNEKIQNFQDDEFNVRILANLNPKYLSIDVTDCYYRVETENIKKYDNESGKQNVVNGFYEYSKTIFMVLTKNQLIVCREKIILKYFMIIKNYVSRTTRLKSVIKTLKLINNNINLSYKELLVLYVLIFLNKYHLNKKGYYTITNYLKNSLIFTNEK